MPVGVVSLAGAHNFATELRPTLQPTERGGPAAASPQAIADPANSDGVPATTPSQRDGNSEQSTGGDPGRRNEQALAQRRGAADARTGDFVRLSSSGPGAAATAATASAGRPVRTSGVYRPTRAPSEPEPSTERPTPAAEEAEAPRPRDLDRTDLRTTRVDDAIHSARTAERATAAEERAQVVDRRATDSAVRLGGVQIGIIDTDEPRQPTRVQVDPAASQAGRLEEPARGASTNVTGDADQGRLAGPAGQPAPRAAETDRPGPGQRGDSDGRAIAGQAAEPRATDRAADRPAADRPAADRPVADRPEAAATQPREARRAPERTNDGERAAEQLTDPVARDHAQAEAEAEAATQRADQLRDDSKVDQDRQRARETEQDDRARREQSRVLEQQRADADEASAERQRLREDARSASQARQRQLQQRVEDDKILREDIRRSALAQQADAERPSRFPSLRERQAQQAANG